jgi:hypothetical protein
VFLLAQVTVFGKRRVQKLSGKIRAQKLLMDVKTVAEVTICALKG